MHDQLDRFGAGYRICLASMRRLVARAALRGSSPKAGGRYRCPHAPMPEAGCRRVFTWILLQFQLLDVISPRLPTNGGCDDPAL